MQPVVRLLGSETTPENQRMSKRTTLEWLHDDAESVGHFDAHHDSALCGGTNLGA